MKAAHIVAAVVLAATAAATGYPPVRSVRLQADPLQAQSALPRDVHPESRNRLPPISRDQLSDQMKKAYDAAIGSSPGGKPEGVAAIRLHRSGVDVRWDAGIGRRLSELSILTIAREYDQPYEWSLHEMEALSVGLEPAIADIVRNRTPVTGIGEKEAAIIQLGREIGRHRVSPDTYARTLKLFGKTDMVDMVDLMSNYAGTGVNLTAANQWMPPQMKQFLPLPFTMPNDILPDSRSRIPVVNPARPAQANGGAGEGANAGLYRRTLAPAPTGPGSMGKFAAGIRSLETSQGKALIALAALITARLHDQQYAWTMNELAARRDGLSAAAIDAVRNNAPITSLPAKEAALIQFGRELLGQHNVSAETYAKAKTTFGQQDLSDFVVNVIAPQTREAVILTVFDQQLPAGQAPLLPMQGTSRPTD
jgi:4-carboxymuconolactone decarboxylase